MNSVDSIAVIGLGGIAERHRRNLKSLIPKAKIISIPTRGKLPPTSVSYADKVIANPDLALKYDPSFAIIASPASYHLKYAQKFLEKRIPILIEKPIASNVKDAMQISLLADQYSTPARIGYCLRYLPSIFAVKEALLKEQLGRIFYISIEAGQYLPFWRPNIDYRDTVSAKRSLGGGVLLELSHELDYIQWLFGEVKVHNSILSHSKELNLDVEDCADITLKGKNSEVINLHLDFLQKKPSRKCRIVGTYGTIEWDLIQNSVYLFNERGNSKLHVNENFDINNIYIDMIKDFLNVLNNKDSIIATPAEAVRTICLIRQILENNRA